jgi:formate C-acetyltransferase
MFELTEDYKSKLKNVLAEPNYTEGSGKPCKQIINEMMDEYVAGDKDVAKMQTQCICRILREARISVEPWDIFADKIDNDDSIEMYRNKFVSEVYENEPDAKRHNEAWAFNQFWAGRDFGHVAPDWDRLFTLGLGGIIDEAKQKRATATADKVGFYDTVIDTYSALSDLIMRFASYVDKTTCNGKKLYNCLTWIAQNPPLTLYEVLELSLIYYRVETSIERDYVRSMGQLDALWEKYYEKDIANGISEEENDNLIKAFFLRLNAFKVVANVPFALGGQTSKRDEAYTKFTRHVYKLYSSLKLAYVKAHVRVDGGIPDSYFYDICADIIGGNSSYVFMNDEIIRKGLQRVGISKEDCKEYLVMGCYEPVCTHHEICSTCNSYLSLPRALTFALNNGVEPGNGEFSAIRTGELDSFKTFEEFVTAVETQLDYVISKVRQYIVFAEENYKKMNFAPLLSGTYADTMESGKDIYEGGMKYNNSGVNLVGIATLVDSLLCIKHFVFDTKQLSLGEFNEILLSNWENNEELRVKCKKYVVKYGNGNTEADALTSRFINFASDRLNGSPNGRGGVFRMGVFSVDTYMNMARRQPATPDGRRNDEFLSKNLTATVGADKEGISGLIRTLASVDFTKAPNGCVLDFIVHPSVLEGEKGAKILWDIVRAHFANGGFAVHGNVFDKKKLIEAQNNPDKYKNLQVRVCGWNAYFVELTKSEQDVFIANSK